MSIFDRFLESLQEDEYEDNEFGIYAEVLEGGTLPAKGREGDAGFDVYASSDFTIQPGEIVRHPLNFKIMLPYDSYAQMEARSGLGGKGMLLLAKVIDRNYVGGIPHVVATNVSKVPLEFKKGDRIAQMIIHPHCEDYFFTEVDGIEIGEERGGKGFGSSGN